MTQPYGLERENLRIEDFLQAREQKGRDSSIKTRESRPSPPGNCPQCSQPGHWASECPTQLGRMHSNPQRNNDKTRKPEREIICYNCNEKGHMSFNCPKTTGLYCEERREDHTDRLHEPHVYWSGYVNGVSIGSTWKRHSTINETAERRKGTKHRASGICRHYQGPT